MDKGSTTPHFVHTKSYDAIWWWFLISSVVVTWDIGYCFMRPRSMPGGDLAWIWKPYAKYVNVDQIYGWEAIETKNGFTNAQSALNVIESLLNFWYCYLGSASILAPLVGFTSVVMTLSKTLLYLLQEYFCDYCATGHNDFHTLFFFWILPNMFLNTLFYSAWIVFPSIIAYILGGDLVKSLRLARQVKGAKRQ